MAPKKNFNNITTSSIYFDALQSATQAEDTEPTPTLKTESVDNINKPLEKLQKKKERKTYTEEETAAALESMKTSGKKGIKLPRINLAFSPANYDYIKTMAQVRGEDMTTFLNHIIEESRHTNQDTYNRALEFRKSL